MANLFDNPLLRLGGGLVLGSAQSSEKNKQSDEQNRQPVSHVWSLLADEIPRGEKSLLPEGVFLRYRGYPRESIFPVA